VQLGHPSDGRRHPWSQRTVGLARSSSHEGFWLVDDDVFGCDERVCALSVMGARRDGIDTQTRVVIVFCYRDGRQV
jgi:hypothetical protein